MAANTPNPDEKRYLFDNPRNVNRLFDGSHNGKLIIKEMPERAQRFMGRFDLNKDGVVDATDLALLLGSWGPY